MTVDIGISSARAISHQLIPFSRNRCASARRKTQFVSASLCRGAVSDGTSTSAVPRLAPAQITAVGDLYFDEHYR